MPKISVIMPCYNQGEYIEEAVQSVLRQTFHDFEIIIVNDGSTCESTNSIISSIRHEKIKCINRENGGLSEARNTGIKNSSGVYILPLDADDKISETYLQKASEILDMNDAAGIVYGEACFFGAKKGEWVLPDFSIERILFENIIFCSAMFRRSDYDRTPGYCSEMKFGWEDWDFWLSMLELGIGVERIREVMFFYRRKDCSMGDGMLRSEERASYSRDVIVRKHFDFYLKNGMNPIALKHRNFYQQIQMDKILNDKWYKLLMIIKKILKFIRRR